MTRITINLQLPILIRRKRGIHNVKQWINIKFENWSILAHVQILPKLILISDPFLDQSHQSVLYRLEEGKDLLLYNLLMDIVKLIGQCNILTFKV